MYARIQQRRLCKRTACLCAVAVAVGLMVFTSGCGVLLAGATGQSIGRAVMMEGGKRVAKKVVKDLRSDDTKPESEK